MRLLGDIQPLVYHRVCPDRQAFRSTYVVSSSAFRRQMEYLAGHGFEFVTLDALIRNSPPVNGRPRILLTFDDGYLDNYTEAYPVLRELNLPAVIFLVADMSRRTNWWDVPMGVPETSLLEPHHIAEMASGGIEFGSHTMSHASLPSRDGPALADELVRSRETIEHLTGKKVRAMSYPYSHVDARTKRAVFAAGYTCAFAVNGGPFRAETDLLEIRRVNVTSESRGVRLENKLSGMEKLGLWLWWRARRSRQAAYEIRRGF